jgi:hypothetical protein
LELPEEKLKALSDAHSEILEALLEAKADYKLTTKDGKDALATAAAAGNASAQQNIQSRMADDLEAADAQKRA